MQVRRRRPSYSGQQVRSQVSRFLAMNHPTVEKYLARHAEPDTFNELEGTYSHVVVIPIANEGPLFLETIESLQAAAKACFAKPLIICVINGRTNAPEALAANRALRSMLWELGPTVTYDPQWSTVSAENCTLLISARFEDALALQPNFIGLRGALCSNSKRENIDPKICQNIIEHFKLINQKKYQEVV